jgi:pyruvate formate-lyase activating enzyme-like uncharacterized protein
MRLEAQCNNYQNKEGNDLPSFHSCRSHIKDIIEIRKRIKKLDHTTIYDSMINDRSLEIETSQERLLKHYDRLMSEYIRNNPELEHTNKKIIICKPFRIRRKDLHQPVQVLIKRMVYPTFGCETTQK